MRSAKMGKEEDGARLEISKGIMSVPGRQLTRRNVSENSALALK